MPFPSAAVEGATTLVSAGVYKTTFTLPFPRALSPGEVLKTNYTQTLLAMPRQALPGKAAIWDFHFDIVASASGAPVPLSTLYNHHFVIYDSTGVDAATVASGAGNWPPAPGDAALSSAAASGFSLATGPCNQLMFARAGGAEWRGVQAALPWSVSQPNATKSGWVTDFGHTAWGLELHVIDLRHVDTQGQWEGNWFDVATPYPGFPAGIPGGAANATGNAPGSVAQMVGISQCAQCNCAYYGLVNNFTTSATQPSPGANPANGGTACCPDGVFCDAFGFYTAQDGAPLSSLNRRRQATLLKLNGSASTNLSDADTLHMAFPANNPWLVNYSFTYSITFSNASALVAAATPLHSAVLSADSALDSSSNGLACATEYTPSTCGACTGASCGPTANFYASLINATNPGGGFDEGATDVGVWSRDRYYEDVINVAPSLGLGPTLTGLSTCSQPLTSPITYAAGSDPLLPYGTSSISFSWVVPADWTLYTAWGHQHVGGVGMRLYAAGPGVAASLGVTGRTWRQLLCRSTPQYGGVGDASPGFVLGMSVCDFRAAPLLLPAGTVLTLSSDYWGDVRPFLLPNSSLPSPFQMPWTGAMGFMFLRYALAQPVPVGGTLAWMTASGAGIPAAPVSPLASFCSPSLGASAGAVPTFVNSSTSVLFSYSPLFWMSWARTGSSLTVTVTLGVSGVWFGIGLKAVGDASTDMSSGDLVVAQLGTVSGTADVAEYWSSANGAPARKEGMGAGNGLSACGWAQGSGWQQMVFTRPLAAGDAYGNAVVGGANTTVLWAMGVGPSLASGHSGQPHSHVSVAF